MLFSVETRKKNILKYNFQKLSSKFYIACNATSQNFIHVVTGNNKSGQYLRYCKKDFRNLS